MSATSRVWGACRSLAVRSRPAVPRTEPLLYSVRPRRWYSDDANNRQPPQSPNQSKGADSPEPSKQASAAGDSPADALSDDALQQLFYGGRAAPKEGDEGLTKAQEESLYHSGRIPSPTEADSLVPAAEERSPANAGRFRRRTEHKFPLPEKPFPADFNHKKRYHPVVDLFVRLIMRDGKLSAAQRHMATLMNVLRTSPAPIYSPKFPLLPGTPPASHLPLNPILYLTVAVDSVAPLLKIKHLAGGAGGGRALEIPVPLHLRTRRRHAFKWILESVSKKPSKGSGRKQFGHRLAEEIIAVVEGRSAVWDKRKTVHKLGTAARINVGSKKKVKKSGKK